nr:GNAT family N-acetyltransferase [Sinorhizobium meliloti]
MVSSCSAPNGHSQPQKGPRPQNSSAAATLPHRRNTNGAERIAALTDVDHVRTENYLAFGESGDPLIATAMLACDPAFERGEVAISIRADYKNRGVGWELLGFLSRVAQAKGVKVLESIERRENRAAIEIEQQMGFTTVTDPDDPTILLVRKELRAA